MSDARQLGEDLITVRTPEVTALKRETAIGLLRRWFPTGGTIYLMRRHRTRSGALLVDCKRLSVTGSMDDIGLSVADALGRPYDYERSAFRCVSRELPQMITHQLSEVLYGTAGKLSVEML